MKSKENNFVYLFIFRFHSVETYTEIKKDTRWKPLQTKEPSFCFKLIPKHQQQTEIFACETEDNRTVIETFLLNNYIISFYSAIIRNG